ISAIIYYFIRFKINLTKTTKFLKKPFQSIIIQVKKPNELETKKELIKKITPRNLLLSPIYTAICHSDVRYYEGDNPPEKLKGKYPLIMFHEGIAKIKEVGKGILSYEKGQKVVVIPNIPCYVHDKRKYSKRKYACECCRNESIGENYCTDVRFMSSNSPGINRTIFEHPTECVVPIPKGVSDKSALMTELLTVNYRAIQEAKIGNKDKIAIIGSGPTGYLMAVLISKYLKIPKQRILITNITDQKLKLSKTIAKTVNTKNGLSLEFENKYDVVFECVGGANTETTIEQAIKLVRPKGTIVLLGVANKKIPINTRQVLDKGIKLIGTSRSGIQDYKDIMVILKNKKLQKYVEKIIYKTEYDGTKITEMKLALSKAKDRNVYGKILIKYD
ncbi:alcohol dehydrogenase catalytic domain-containing protein, partial [Candidatus Woesearchaeota archaeon]|nr:alcohol dehydrogenase catalytic domain-containing protein [Candidatus Woesearchaeota archaeon]